MLTLPTHTFFRKKPPPGAQINWSHPLARGLFGCWLFNEGSAGLGSPAYDLSQPGHGLSNFGPKAVAANFGNGLKFVSASSQYLQYSAVRGSLPSAPLSILCWFNLTAQGANGTVAGLWDSTSASLACYALEVSGGTLNAQDNSSQAKVPLSYIAWHQGVGVFQDNTTRSVYLDGSGKATNVLFTAAPTTDSITVGRRTLSTPSTYFNGFIDHVIIWTRALTDGEVAWLYQDPFAFLAPPGTRRWFLPPKPVTALSASLQSQVTLTGSATRTAGLTATVGDVVALTATASRTAGLTAALHDVVTLTATAKATHILTAALASRVTLTATATRTAGLTAALHDVVTLTPTAKATYRPTAALQSVVTLAAAGKATYRPTASLQARVTLTASATRTAGLTAALASRVTLTATATRTAGLTAALHDVVTLTPTAKATYRPTAALQARVTLTASAQASHALAAALQARATLTATATRTAGLSAALQSVVTLAAALVDMGARKVFLTGSRTVTDTLTGSRTTADTLTGSRTVTDTLSGD